MCPIKVSKNVKQIFGYKIFTRCLTISLANEAWRLCLCDIGYWSCHVFLQSTLHTLIKSQNEQNCKSLPFFYFLNFEKGRLLYIHPVGRLVGWLTSPLIFFNIYRHNSPLLTQYHLIPHRTML